MRAQELDIREPFTSSTPGIDGVEATTLATESSTDGQSLSPRAVERRPLKIVTLAVLIFYNVSGGPFGSEEVVSAGGPLFGLLGFAIMPLLWSVPEALVTAELATTFPDDAGYVVWVSAAFGPFWGFIEGVLSLTCAMIDQAIYPTLFVVYLKYVLCGVPPGVKPDEVTCPVLDRRPFGLLPSGHVLLVLVANTGLTYLNWRGLAVVGRVSVWLTVFLLAPFLLLCVLGLPRLDPSRWISREVPGTEPGTHQKTDWATLLNVLFWNLNYWDTASCIAGEVSDPGRTFPRALAFAVLLVMATYLLPLAVSVGALDAKQAWGAGFFVQAGYEIGGPFLQYWILLGAAVSNIGQFLSEQAGNAYQMLGMAELGHLPACFAARSKHGTPFVGLALTLLVTVSLAGADIDALMSMLNGIYCLAELLEFAAFLQLRRKFERLHRPFRIPLGTAGCALLLAAPSATCVLVLALSVWQGELRTVAVIVGAALLGPTLYIACGECRRRQLGTWLGSEPLGSQSLDGETDGSRGSSSYSPEGSSQR